MGIVGKYHRNYILAVGPTSNRDTGVITDPTIKIIQPPFSLRFDVSRANLAVAGTFNIDVYNLAEQSRNALRKDWSDINTYKKVELRAGYGTQLSTIAKGNVLRGYSDRNGVDFITRLECQDGGAAYTASLTEQGFGTGTPQATIIDAFLKTMAPQGITAGVVSPIFSADASGNPIVLARGNSFSNYTTKAIGEVVGDGFFIDLEVAHVLANNDCILGVFSDIDSSHGLLGTPLLQNTILTFDMIFEPRLLIGQLINLTTTTAKNYSGQWKLSGLKHRGMISDSECGEAVSSLSLMRGTGALKVVA